MDYISLMQLWTYKKRRNISISNRPIHTAWVYKFSIKLIFNTCILIAKLNCRFKYTSLYAQLILCTIYGKLYSSRFVQD